MKRSRFLLNILPSFLAAFSGAVIWKQFELFLYFYNSKVDDFLSIMLVTLLSGFLTFKYLKYNKSIVIALQSITLVIGVILFKVSYTTFQYFDLLSLSTYLFNILAAVSIVLFIKKRENKFQHLLFILGVALVGGFIQFLAQGSIFIFISSLSYLVLRFIHSRSESEKSLQWIYGFLFLFLAMSIPLISSPFKLYESQKSYYDKVVYSQDTPFQTIDVTEWKGQRWYYYNGINNFSTIDEWLYYEPLVYPVLELAGDVNEILVIGGDNGLAIREILKYNDVLNIEHVTLDTALCNLAKSHELFTSINNGSLTNHRVNSQQQNIFRHLNNHPSTYDIIIIDIPDPVDIELNQYYTKEFYKLCYNALSEKGMLVTQAGSPYFATEAYYCISNTIQASQFSVLEMHNQVLTMGEWGWIIGAKHLNSEQLNLQAKSLTFSHLSTAWLNNEAMNMMLSFGKINTSISDTIVNTLKKPVVHAYYTKGTWDFN